ncbi:MAG: YdcF family protein [Provencibacterium sp.]|nr:YdcF family protein [Provencibacterium sp.]
MKRKISIWPAGLTAGEKAVRIFMLLAAALCFFYSAVPLLGYGIFHTGVAVLALFCGAFGGCLLWGDSIGKRFPRLYRWGRRALLAAFLAALLLYLLFAGAYRRYCVQNPPERAGARTVIVLGGAIDGEEPKLMLARRLRAAAGYLEENPEAVCIVSGGQGPDEDFPEALVMEKYLLRLGIPQERIRQEDRSATTRQNIAFSAEIIRREGFPGEVVIATDDFHQLRAAYFCRRNGLEPSALTSLTPWGLLPSYEIREMGAWVKALLESAAGAS